MSIQQEVDRIGIAKNAIRNAIEAKGVSVPSTTSIDNYAEKIAEIPYSPPTPVPTYQIHVGMPVNHDVSIPSRAKAGTIIFTAKHKTTGDHYIYKWAASGNHMDGAYICVTKMIPEDEIDKQADVVREAYANLPDTMAPPPTFDGYCQWFVMPPCNVYIL